MKKDKKRLSIIIIITYVIVGIITGVVINIFIAAPFSKTSIQMYKDDCYDIYNEGIAKVQDVLGYDNININSSCKEDQKILYNQGLKYVTYPDLMDFELYNTAKVFFLNKEITYEKIEFSKNEFRIYNDSNNPLYLKITVDRDHTADITYYQYEECLDFKIALKNCTLYIIFFIVAVIITLYKLDDKIMKTKSKH